VRDDERLGYVTKQLAEYFDGARSKFDLSVAFRKGNGFQRRVWQELLAIPFGETRSYGEIARRIGMPDAARAVGSANGLNPVSIVVPCHRVIGADGGLTGYGGGLERKRWLLDHESGPPAQGSLPGV
jgi:methylated-DNA-[protein]-cysteine S-methyltransferase